MTDAISTAVQEAMKPVSKWEKQWDSWKLETRMTQYFRNGIKEVEFGERPWDDLVYQYADQVFQTIFNALQDRSWLRQVDFMPVLRSSVRELFPATELAEVPKEEFEKVLLCAHDQAYEEIRFGFILHELISEKVKEKKLRSRLYSVFEAGRRDAVMMDLTASTKPAEDFAWHWIVSSIEYLRSESGGWPEQLFQQSQAIWLFQTLISSGVFPASITPGAGQLPAGWPVVAAAVKAGYAGSGKRKVEAKSEVSKLTMFTIAGNVAYGGQSAAKRLKGASRHPLCTQAEDCLGDAKTSSMFRHIDASDSSEGDLYCSDCWSAFSAADPLLKALPVDC